jgi:hypothetical protein
MLPEWTLEYFEITHIVKDKEGLVLFLEEKNLPPAEYNGQRFTPKAFAGSPGTGFSHSPAQS